MIPNPSRSIKTTKKMVIICRLFAGFIGLALYCRYHVATYIFLGQKDSQFDDVVRHHTGSADFDHRRTDRGAREMGGHI